jgi:hypothetical protein
MPSQESIIRDCCKSAEKSTAALQSQTEEQADAPAVSNLAQKEKAAFLLPITQLIPPGRGLVGSKEDTEMKDVKATESRPSRAEVVFKNDEFHVCARVA